MHRLKVLLPGFGLIALLSLAASAQASCIDNETDRAVQVQIGDWNQIVGPNEKKCAEGQGGLVSVWTEPSGETGSPDSIPDVSAEVDKEGTIKITSGSFEEGPRHFIVYGPDGKEQTRFDITETRVIK